MLEIMYYSLSTITMVDKSRTQVKEVAKILEGGIELDALRLYLS